ncbi:hypothetical protein [Vibrio breoganii]|uniref:hypothetical protein n=1 Tax=Vibrio breoganii TaxID=553239 RepID=UPI001F522ED6|nr:hypothetical protein [Vibrio breoganii]
MELNGRLPGAKQALLSMTDQFLSMNRDEQNNFILGRRIHYYTKLQDMGNKLYFDTVQQQLSKIGSTNLDAIEDAFYHLRQRMI